MLLFMSNKTCVYCGSRVLTGRKYCHKHRSLGKPKEQPKKEPYNAVVDLGYVPSDFGLPDDTVMAGDIINSCDSEGASIKLMPRVKEERVRFYGKQDPDFFKKPEQTEHQIVEPQKKKRDYTDAVFFLLVLISISISIGVMAYMA